MGLQTLHEDRPRVTTVFGEMLYEELRNTTIVNNLRYYSNASLETVSFHKVL